MLLVTADIFSGRPNPSWVVTDENEEKALLRDILNHRDIVTAAAPEVAGLGFRGVIVEPASDEFAQDAEVPATMYIPLGAGSAFAKGSEIAERLIALIPESSQPAGADAMALPLDESLQIFLQEQMEWSGRTTAQDGGQAPTEEEFAPSAICYYDITPYNPGFWNNDANVRTRNNCYNYASNKRTNTFAQPGRGCGRMYTAINCPEVTRGALCDGLHRRYDCFPQSEYPRHLVAMAVAPGPGFVDYHWYRLQREGFWAHKPGGTAVRNVDNSNVVITNPATCNRGPYTIFCGYFYTCKSQRIN